MLQGPRALQQVGAHRHRHLGGGGGRRRPAVGGEVDQRHVGLVPHGGDQGDFARGCGAHHDFLVEGPEVLQAAAAAGDDQHVGPRHRPARDEAVEALDGGRDLLRRARTLHRDRPDQHPAGEAVFDTVQDVANHGARGRGHDAHRLRQVRQVALARFVEQALGGERLLAGLQQREQGAGAGKLQPLDHDLVARAPRIGADLAGGDDLEPVLRRDPEPAGDAAPADGVEHRVRVLEREVKVARCGALEARDLAPHADPGELALDHALERLRELADREDRPIVAVGEGGVRLRHRLPARAALRARRRRGCGIRCSGAGARPPAHWDRRRPCGR